MTAHVASLRVYEPLAAFDGPARAHWEAYAARPDLPWEAKNQAAVHTWYAAKFGGPPVEPHGQGGGRAAGGHGGWFAYLSPASFRGA